MNLYTIEAAHVNAEAARLGFNEGIAPDKWEVIQKSITDMMDEIQATLIQLAIRDAFPEKAGEINKRLPKCLT